jgi:serine phosphatase RsbU (regulator of sigma subunit)
MALFEHYIARRIPERVVVAGPEAVRRARVLVMIAMIATPWLPMFLGLYLALGSPLDLLAGFALTMVVVALVPEILRWSQSIELAGNIFVAAAVTLCAWLSHYVGGLFAPALDWLLPSPVIALMLVSRRSAIVWLVVVMAAVGVYFVAPDAARASTFLTPDGLRVLKVVSTTGLAMLLFTIVWSFERAKDRMRLELEASMRRLEDNQQQLVSAEREAAVAPFERELAIAQRIQTSILPRRFDVAGLEIAAGMATASEVGGDYYDVSATDDGGCWIGIGDVSGHGINAGLIMLMMQSGLASLMRAVPSAEPHVLVNLVNRMLFENVRARLAMNDFATLAVLRCHRDGRLATAGAHEEMVIWRAATATCETIPTEGTWVGATKDVARHTRSKPLQLHDGDVVLLYTDGITEAMSSTREQFGLERLRDVLALTHAAPVQQICDRVFDEVRAWSPELVDDRTVLVFRYRAPAPTRAA